jgi:hypothetical protein
MDSAPLDHERVRDLGQIGLIAAREGETDIAESIFAAIALTHPDRALPYAGQTLARLHAGCVDRALESVDLGLRMVRCNEQADLHALRAVVLTVSLRPGEAQLALRQARGHVLAEAMLSQTFLPSSLARGV